MDENNISIKTICEQFWEFEKEQGLLNLNIKDIKFWQLIRFEIFSEITKKKGLFGQAHTQKNSLADKLFEMPKKVLNSITKNPMIGTYTKDILIFDHNRKIKDDEDYIDIYTKNFIDSLNKEKFEVIESPHLRKHLTNKKDKNRKYDDAISLNVFINKLLSKSTLTKNDSIKLTEIEKEILKKFHVKVELKDRTEKEILNFKLRYKSYMRLIKRRKALKVYLVVSYGREPLIAAAKTCGVEVIEFQHGVISPYHIAYNFPHIKHGLDYFPDKILLFGEYWKKSVHFPEGVELKILGFPYLQDKVERYKGVTKREKQILFLSQGTIGRKLSVNAAEIARKLPDYNIIYKLHPGEYARWKDEYPELVSASNLENLEIIDNNETELYNYLAESGYQIGVYSTAIFEGLALNCKTILFNAPGIEYMEDLIDEGIVAVVEDYKEAIFCLEQYRFKRFNKGYFFKE